jgi:7-carboxy-7-deazaguanine synthase
MLAPWFRSSHARPEPGCAQPELGTRRLEHGSSTPRGAFSFLDETFDLQLMKINEIFHSIQGESSYAGLPCTFVRLTFCNLRCSYCDSGYAFFEGREMTVGEALQEIGRHGCRLVEITGGEPLLQEEVYPLIDRLLAGGFTVLLETSGSVDIGRVNPQAVKIMDLKCPSSGESEKNLFSNLDQLQPHDEVKFVIGSQQDYLWAKGVIEQYGLSERCQVLLSTVFGQLPPRQVVEWMLADGLKARFQLQLHKYIWDATTRGV